MSMASGSLPQLSRNAPQMGNAVGRITISKLFDINGELTLFKGTVVKYDKKAKYYLVVYEDSDREELDWEDVMKLSPAWIKDDTSTPAAGPPAKLRKNAKTKDVSTAAAAIAAANAVPDLPPKQSPKQKRGLAAKAACAQKQKQQQPNKHRDPAAATKVAENAPAPASKCQNKAQAATAAAAVATAGGSKAVRVAGAAAAGGADAPKRAGKCSTKPSAEGTPVAAAAAGAGAAAAKPSTPRSRADAVAKTAVAKDQAAATATAVAGGKKASKKSLQQASLQQQQQQQDRNVQAGTDQEADRVRAVQPVKVKPLPEYGPARMCEEAWRDGAAAFIADMAGIRGAALQAADVVALKDGRPVFEAQPEDLPVAHSAEGALKELTRTAACWKPGQEPHHRMALPPLVMDLLLQRDADSGIAAAAAAMAPKLVKPKKPADSTDASTAAVAPAAAEVGQQQGEQQRKGVKKLASLAAVAGAAAGDGQKKKGSKKLASSIDDSAAAAAAATAGEGQHAGQKMKGGKKRPADTEVAADQRQQRQKGTKKQKASATAAAAAAPAAAEDAEEGSVRQHRALWIPVQDSADPDGKLAQAMKDLRTDYDTAYRTAQQSEEERYAKVTAENAAAEKRKLPPPDETPAQKKLTKPSRRADRVAESAMMQAGRQVNDRPWWGAVPGCRVNHKYELRALSSLVGMHKAPVSGMVHAPLPYPVVVGGKVYPKLKAITSVVASGTYMADNDGHTHDEEVKVTTVYTGQGGCDLLGGKQQVRDQELKDANRHMLVNWALGIPVRYLRRNDDSDSTTGTSLIYDGLYYITSCCRQYVAVPPKGESKGGKFLTFVYGLRRLPGQAAPLSAPIPHWKATGTAKVQPSIERRPHAMCRDISKGVEAAAEGGQQGKASTRVVAINEVDNMLPPGLHVEKDKALLLPPPDGRSWQADKQTFRYIRNNTYAPNVPPPKPPKLLTAGTPAAKAAEAAILAAAAAGSKDGCGQFVPSTWPNAPLWNAQHVIQTKQEAEDSEHGPHKLLARLNGGYLPYTLLTKKVGAKATKQVAVAEPRILPRVLIECGEHLGCKDPDCPQRQAHRRLQYRLEVYKTQHCGWGVQSWDPVYAGTLVCTMIGRIMRKEDVGDNTEYGDSAYVFDMLPRPDVNHLGKPLKPQQPQLQQRVEGSTQGAGSSKQEQQKEQENTDSEQEAAQGSQGRPGQEAEAKNINKQDAGPRFVLCARDEGNVARFINHSCEPNLYVQPILSGHTNTDHVLIGLFACRDIPPFTPFSYDYGEQYIKVDLEGDCKCGADSCYSKLPKNQVQDKPAASCAPSPTAAAAAAAAGGGDARGSSKQKNECCGGH